MKVRVYGAQQDELIFYDKMKDEYGFEFTFAKEVLNLDTVNLTKGYDALIIVTVCKITKEVAKALHENGVKYIAARSAGTDHINYNAVKEYDLKAANVPYYSPRSIAEHTIMMALNVLRHSKKEARMVAAGDFRMTGLKGKELGALTVGVLGTGRIGYETMKLLKGFGCDILAYDLYPNEKAKKICRYVTDQTLFSKADMIILHCPLIKENYHCINEDAIQKMKEGVFIINTARGGLVDEKAVLVGLNSEKIAGFGFDVCENEAKFVRKNTGIDQIDDGVFLELLNHENTYYTAHVAFYTDKAIESMIKVSLDNIKEYELTGECRNEVHH